MNLCRIDGTITVSACRPGMKGASTVICGITMSPAFAFRRHLARCRQEISPISTVAFVLCLLCLAPVRGYGYDFFNDWPFYETPISEAPATHSLNGPAYQHTTWFDAVLVWIHAPSSSPVLKLKLGGLSEVIYNNGNELAIEVYGLYKAANGDWWAEQVLIYRDSNCTLLENKNLGQDPLTVTTAAPGASDLTLSSEIREPYHEYKPPVVTLSANGISTSGGEPVNVDVQPGATLTLNMSASDANGNCERTRLWAKAGENGDWSEIYNSTVSSGSCSYTFGPLAGHYYFKSRAMDDTDAESMSAIIHVEATGTANSAPTVTINNPPATIMQGEPLNLSSIATDAEGNLNLHSFYRRGPRVTDNFSGDSSGWVRDADSTAGWSSFSAPPGVPTSGANSNTAQLVVASRGGKV